MSFKTWQYAFVNGMDYDVQKNSYYQYAIPESKRVVRDTITKAAKIHFNNPHPPLLLIAGSDDHTIPASLNYSNFKRYRKNAGVIGFKEFTGRNHFVLGQEGWEEVADHILHWLHENA
ncbi:MAG: hypothetical protein EOO68_28805 [Moraxellaceae bacterium]|nr:MAG: hypothetical protein EOO68_28805 [Moraxellaceae bacterium]